MIDNSYAKYIGNALVVGMTPLLGLRDNCPGIAVAPYRHRAAELRLPQPGRQGAGEAHCGVRAQLS